jgi:hypothetical protein
MMEYQYGYFVAGHKVILGFIEDDKLEQKQREINHANKIDAASSWFIELAATLPPAEEEGNDDE